jgi:regulator of protease activity HflC (stomatin/prohibitin superfamily)
MARTVLPPDDDPNFDWQQAARRILRAKRPPAAALIGLAVLALGIFAFCYVWFVQRVEVGSGELLVLIRKVGKELPAEFADQIVLSPELLRQLGEPPNSTRYKGIIYEPLTEGRYFFDPFFWDTRIVEPVVLAKGSGKGELDQIGVKVRLYGKPLPPGKAVATEPFERGPVAEVLTPNRYNLNPFAYEVKRVQPVIIPEGYVGVQTLFAGRDPEQPNDFVVQSGERGVQPDVLPPGMYYNNPYVRRIDLMETRTQSLDLVGSGAIRFPSNDSFQIVVEATVQYAVRQERVPYILTAIGDHVDIAEKLILPFMRSISRIEGSKLLARDFISGEQRLAWQDKVLQQISEKCYTQGIDIQQVLIRRIDPPPQIAAPISERQVADQEINRYRKEIDLAKSQAAYVTQEEMQKLNRALGEANREVVTVTKEARQRSAVALTEAQKRLEVARLRLEAARQQAEARLARGRADAEIIRLGAEAEAEPLREAILAFGGGEAYAQYYFYQKLGPALKSILASTDGPFAEIFRNLSRTAGNAGFRPPPPPTSAPVRDRAATRASSNGTDTNGGGQ